jgi:molybdopterin-guanine dinucleotide biosynthesis protein A
MPSREDITGLVLAGGQGRRMGGQDKGLQMLHGRPLVAHALQALASQVNGLMISANRNLEVYRALGHPVWPDDLPDQPGPLAGLLCGLSHCPTPWLASVPCDSPCLPADLVAGLAEALHSQSADLAMVTVRARPDAPASPQPVFTLLHRALADSIANSLAQGQRSVLGWARQHRVAWAEFTDVRAFANANTLDDLHALAAPSCGPETANPA